MTIVVVGLLRLLSKALWYLWRDALGIRAKYIKLKVGLSEKNKSRCDSSVDLLF